jgi:hypothetical protein
MFRQLWIWSLKRSVEKAYTETDSAYDQLFSLDESYDDLPAGTITRLRHDLTEARNHIISASVYVKGLK